MATEIITCSAILLQHNTIIVDTPGIGESNEMTDKLLQYLPKAVAFIYVINSSNAGGVQSDRVILIGQAKNSGFLHNHYRMDIIIIFYHKNYFMVNLVYPPFICLFELLFSYTNFN